MHKGNPVFEASDTIRTNTDLGDLFVPVSAGFAPQILPLTCTYDVHSFSSFVRSLPLPDPAEEDE